MSASRPQHVRAATSEVAFDDMLARSGSAAHPFVRKLIEPGAIARETMADVLHHLSLLHGHRPSLFEIVTQSPLAPAPEWLNASMRAFSRERDSLARLMVAGGPVPSRVGQTHVEEAVNATRNALVTLAGSDRLGCAVGAAVALLLDWDTIAAALRAIGTRLDLIPAERHHDWPARAESLGVARTAAELPGGERAVRFGFQTLLAQHMAFWDIVASRAKN